MIRFRASLVQTRLGWAVLLGLVLAMRVAIPRGYMPVWTGGQFLVEPCDGTGVMAAPAPGNSCLR